MATSILKEFLVKLGFSVDDKQFREMQKRILGITENVVALGAAATAVADLVDRNVTRIAESYDRLYFTSLRVGASAQNLQAFGYAAQFLGVSTGSAEAAIAGLSRTMRNNPGVAAWLQGQGINTNGDTTDVLYSFLKKIQNQPRYMQTLYSQMAGLNPDDVFMLEQDPEKLLRKRDEYNKMLQNAGLNPDEVKKESNQFGDDTRRLAGEIQVFQALIVHRFLPVVDSLVRGLSAVAGFAGRLDELTNGASTYGIGIGATVATGLGGFLGSKWILSLLKKFIGKGAGAGAAAGEGEAAAAGAEGVGVVAEAGGAGALALEIAPVVAAVLVALGLGYLFHATGLSESNNPLAWLAAPVPMALGKLIDHFTKDDDSKPNSWTGTKLPAFFSQGLEAFERHYEGGQNKKDGLFHRYPSAEGGTDTMGYGHKLRPGENYDVWTEAEAREHLRIDLNEARAAAQKAAGGRQLTPGQLDALTSFAFGTKNFADTELLRLVRAGKMDEAAAHFSKYDIYHDRGGHVIHSDWLHQKRLGEEAMFRGGVTIPQDIDINIHGANDPHSTARHVGSELRDITGQIVRNAVGVPW